MCLVHKMFTWLRRYRRARAIISWVVVSAISSIQGYLFYRVLSLVSSFLRPEQGAILIVEDEVAKILAMSLKLHVTEPSACRCHHSWQLPADKETDNTDTPRACELSWLVISRHVLSSLWTLMLTRCMILSHLWTPLEELAAALATRSKHGESDWCPQTARPSSTTSQQHCCRSCVHVSNIYHNNRYSPKSTFSLSCTFGILANSIQSVLQHLPTFIISETVMQLAIGMWHPLYQGSKDTRHITVIQARWPHDRNPPWHKEFRGWRPGLIPAKSLSTQ